MKSLKLRVVSGDFTTVGNFSGYTATGKRVHIFDRQIKALGIKKGDDLSKIFPLFVMAEEKSYGPRVGADGKVVEGAKAIENRLTATAVFKAKSDLVEAASEDLTLDAEVASNVSDKMKALNLTDETIANLISAI